MKKSFQNYKIININFIKKNNFDLFLIPMDNFKFFKSRRNVTILIHLILFTIKSHQKIILRNLHVKKEHVKV